MHNCLQELISYPYRLVKMNKYHVRVYKASKSFFDTNLFTQIITQTN